MMVYICTQKKYTIYVRMLKCLYIGIYHNQISDVETLLCCNRSDINHFHIVSGEQGAGSE